MMLQLIDRQLIEVPTPQIAPRTVLIRVSHALLWHSPTRDSAARRLWRRYPNAARKWLNYARYEGLASTYHKTRARLDTLHANDVGGLSSVTGTITAIGAGVTNFAVGDRVAGYGFARPAYADWLLLPADWCCAVPNALLDHPLRVAALLPGLFALTDDANANNHLAERFARVLAGSLQPALPDPDQQVLSLYSDFPVFVPDWAQPERYFDLTARGTFDSALRAIPQLTNLRAGQKISTRLAFLISDPVKVYSIPKPQIKRAAQADQLTDRYGVSVIGAGDYVRSIVLPALTTDSSARSIEKRGIADLNPAAAAMAVTRFGFAFASTDTDALFDDPGTQGLFIASYHDTHAPFAIRALEKGIAVFVEKPPVTSWDQLRALLDTYERQPGFLAVGYNRRFAPALLRLRRLLSTDQGPLTIVCMVQGHALPPTHWYHGVRQGSQIAGNICHWIDLCVWLTRPALPVHVVSTRPLLTRDSAQNTSNVSITLTFADGSLATIVFTDRGDRLRGVQELIEVRRGGLSVSIGGGLDSLRAVRDGRVIDRWQGGRDKGHTAELKTVQRAMLDKMPAPIPFSETALSSVLMLCAIDSLSTGQAVTPDAEWLARCIALH